MEHVSHHPSLGSPRYGVMLEIPDLRFWLICGFPYVLFYLEQNEYVDVLRILHQHLDLPAFLQEDETS